MPTDDNVRYEYRFDNRRHGEQSQLYEVKTFEGKDREACDRLAEEHGKRLSRMPSMQSEIITVARIDVPAVCRANNAHLEESEGTQP